jgi:hypothetical protein
MLAEQQTTQKTVAPKPVAIAGEQAMVAPVDDQATLMGVMQRLGDDRSPLSPTDGALLQRTVGNQATGILLGKKNSAESIQNASVRSFEAITRRIEEQDGLIARKTDDTIQRDIWDYLPSWGSTTTSGEALDTTSASLEAADEAQKVAKGLEASSLLAEGSKLKVGSDAVGSVGGAISGAKDMGEAYEEGVGVQSGLKMVGGAGGLAGGVVKGADAFGGEQAKQLLEKVAEGGGETIGGWLDFISGGTKAMSGVYLTGKSQLHYNWVKAISSGSPVQHVKDAADQLMGIINEKWWSGMWDTGIGALDMTATYAFPAYKWGSSAAKITGATSKLVGGDIIWKTISYASGGRIRSNDDIDDQIGAKMDTLKSGAMTLANAALLENDLDNLKNLYYSAKEFAPEYAEALSSAVKMGRVNGLAVSATEMRRRKQTLKGTIWE